MALAMGAAMPFIRDKPPPEMKRVVIVIETGITSMAIEGHDTRLNLAKQLVMEQIEQVKDIQFALISAHAFPNIVLPWTTDRMMLKNRLAELSATAAPTNWTAALDLARTLVGLKPSQVLMVGSAINKTMRIWHQAHLNFPADILPLVVGSSQRNRGIDGWTTSIERDPLTGEEKTYLEVTVRGVGLGISDSWMRQQSDLVIRSPSGKIQPHIEGPTYSIAGPGDVLERYFIKLNGVFDELVLSLDTEDALSVDNQAIIYFRHSPDVLVVEPRLEHQKLITKQLEASIRTETIKVIAELTDKVELTAYDLLIVNDRIPLNSWPPINTLIYADSRDTQKKRFADHIPSLLTRYVNVVSPFLLRAKTINVGEFMQTVMYHKNVLPVTGKAEPLAAWGKHESRRKVVIGWDWITTGKTAHKALSIVWLHALDWLSPNKGSIWTGKPFPIPSSKTDFQLIGPNEDKHDIKIVGGQIEPEMLTNAGRYRLFEADKLALRFAANARCASLLVDKGPLKSIKGEVLPFSPLTERYYKDLIWWIIATIILVGELIIFLFFSRGDVR